MAGVLVQVFNILKTEARTHNLENKDGIVRDSSPVYIIIEVVIEQKLNDDLVSKEVSML